jgi:prepilin-type N-terminal cleavage/methylation domain-containing protein
LQIENCKLKIGSGGWHATANCQPSTATSPRAGFTLVELVFAMAITSILVGALGATLVISTTSLDLATSAAANNSQGSDLADTIARDVNLATTFTERTANAITFTIPDRNNDAQADTIRYAWSGQAGAPLTRQYNNLTAVTMAPSVQRFNLSYLSRTMGTAPTNQSREQLLTCHITSPGGSYQDYTIDKNHWAAQYFLPTLPANTTSWGITRVRVALAMGNWPFSNYMVEIRNADPSSYKPTTTIQSMSLSAWSLPGYYDWIDVPFTSVTGLDPAKGCCIVVRQTYSWGSELLLEYDQGGSGLLGNSNWMTTSNGGGSWSTASTTQDMRFYVYGTVTSP